MSQWEDIPVEDENKWEDVPVEGQKKDQRSTGEVVVDALNPMNWPRNAAAGLGEAAQFIDKYTGAPVRKFVTELATGEDLEKAPTGAEQAKMIMNKIGANDPTLSEAWGVPEKYGSNVRASDIYGVSLEMLQDPLMIVGELAKPISKFAKSFGAADDVARSTRTTEQALEQIGQQTAGSTAKAKAAIQGGDLDVTLSGQPFEIVKPQSLEELKNYKPIQNAGEMTGLKRLGEIESIVQDIQTKPLEYHKQMFENPKAMKELKLKFENLPTEDAKAIAAYNNQMLKEATDKIGTTINQYSKEAPKNLNDAGFDFIENVKNTYNNEKEMLGPVFQKMQKNSYKLNKRASQDMILGIGENSKLGNLLTQAEDGRFTLAPNKPRSGVTSQEYGVLKDVIDDLNDGMTFQEIQKTREYLRGALDRVNPQATKEIEKVRSILLDQLQNLSKGMGDEVRNTFQKYAINERSRENVEKIIGGSIESLDQMYAANPDKVVKKIFSNPNYVQVVEGYVGPDVVNNMIGSYLKSGVDAATDSAKGFSPEKFKSWLNSNQTFVRNYVDPKVAERLNALADYGYYAKRFNDEVNPSGTAASILESFKPGNIAQSIRQKGLYGTLEAETAGRLSQKLEQRSAQKSIDELLSGVKPELRPSLMKRMQENPQFKVMKNIVPDFTTIESLRRTAPAIRELDKQKINQNEKQREPQSFNEESSQEALIQKMQGTPYAQMLQNAAQKGEQSFAAANYVLQQRDENYRKKLRGE